MLTEAGFVDMYRRFKLLILR